MTSPPGPRSRPGRRGSAARRRVRGKRRRVDHSVGSPPMADRASSIDRDRQAPAQPAEPLRPAQPEQDRRRRGNIVLSPAAADKVLPGVHTTEDERFLQRPKRPEFLDTDPWRALRILSEFVDGFDALAAIGPAVTIFGSARTPEGSREYENAREVGRRLAQAGFAVITGG